MRAQRRILKALARRPCRAGWAVLCAVICCWPALDSEFLPDTLGQATQDPMRQHYEAAQSSLRSGDQQRAALEYRAFLGEAIHRIANAKARSGDWSAAAQSFEEALAFTGPEPATRLDYASVLFDANRLKEAQPVAQSVVDAEPKNARARVLAGRIFFEQKDYPAAKVQFEAATALGEIDEVWRLLSICYLRLEELGSARSLLQHALATLGDTPANHVAVAEVYYYGDHPDQAIEELKKAIARSGTVPDAHYYLGLACLARNEEAGYPKAIPEFLLELKTNPNDFRSRYMLGYIALKQRKFDDAERELTSAVALNPDDKGARLLLGQLYSETHRGPQAEAALRQLIASSDENTPTNELIRAHYILGRALQEDGRLEDGTSEIRKSEHLRTRMRLSSADLSEGKLQSPGDAASKGIESLPRRQSVTGISEQDKAQVKAFIDQISLAIAEGYYNLGGIADRNKDSAAAALYLQKAREWDPSLAPQKQ